MALILIMLTCGTWTSYITLMARESEEEKVMFLSSDIIVTKEEVILDIYVLTSQSQIDIHITNR